MAGVPIRGRDYKNYERRAAAAGNAPVATPYKNDIDIPKPPGGEGSQYVGKEALFNRYYSFFYSGPGGMENGSILGKISYGAKIMERFLTTI